MLVATYVRARAKDQQSEAEERKAQQVRLDYWAQERGFTVIASFQDSGYSARDLGRPALCGLLEAAKANPRPFDAVLATTYSRLARDADDFAYLTRQLQESGVAILVSDTPPETSEPIREVLQRFIDRLDEFAARDESAPTSED
jgi:DNA invertase Pin-like site-specific DNA recombinase